MADRVRLFTFTLDEDVPTHWLMGLSGSVCGLPVRADKVKKPEMLMNLLGTWLMGCIAVLMCLKNAVV